MLHPPTGCRFHPRCTLVQPMHTRIIPALREARPGHFVACHLYDEAVSRES
jgi:ABC-type dipeptide/oligopeptide/nickel transport system ATPase component